MVSPPFEDSLLQDNRQRETQGVDVGRVILTRSGVRTMYPFRRMTFGRAKSQESPFSQQHLPSIPCHLAPKAIRWQAKKARNTSNQICPQRKSLSGENAQTMVFVGVSQWFLSHWQHRNGECLARASRELARFILFSARVIRYDSQPFAPWCLVGQGFRGHLLADIQSAPGSCRSFALVVLPRIL